MDAGALDAEQHTQVDAGPARVRLAAVTTLAVAGHVLHPLQHTLTLDAAFPRTLVTAHLLDRKLFPP